MWRISKAAGGTELPDPRKSKIIPERALEVPEEEKRPEQAAEGEKK